MKFLPLLLLASCTAAPAAAPLAWEPEARAVGEGRDGALVIPPSEAATLVYADVEKNLAYARSHDGGDAFPKPVAVNAVPGEVKAHGESAPWIELGPKQEVLAAWEGNGEIRFARSTNFGRSFNPPVVVNDGPEKAHQSFLHMDAGADGTVAVAWLDFRDYNDISVYAAVSKDAGGTWAPNVKVAGAVCPCCRPAVAVGNGAIAIVWRHVYPTHVRDLAASTSRDGGKTWSAPARVAVDGWVLDGCPHSGPSMVFLGDVLGLAWYTGAAGRASLRFSTSKDFGASWSAPVELQGGLQDANHPYLAAFEGAFWVIFQARDGAERGGWGPLRPWVSRIGAAPQALPTLGGGVNYPRLAAGNAGRLYAIWSESNGPASKVVLCRGRLR